MTCIQKRVRPFTALHEDTEKGWVWLLLPGSKFRSRSTIKIIHGSYAVYCQHRNFDANFVRQYDSSPDTTSILYGANELDHFRQKQIAEDAVRHCAHFCPRAVEDVIVISGWYRNALDIKGPPQISHKDCTTDACLHLTSPSCEPKAPPADLIICKPLFSQWADIRAGCQHPEPGVRIATRLAILGTWLGAAAFLLALAIIEPVKLWARNTLHRENPDLDALIIALLFLFFCIYAGRGVQSRPTLYGRLRYFFHRRLLSGPVTHI